MGIRRSRPLTVVLALIAAGVACSGDGAPDPSGSETRRGDGILSTVDVREGPHSTLTAMVQAETTDDAEVSVHVEADEGWVEDPPATAAGTTHEVGVVGLRAETTYTLTVSAEGTGGEEESVDVEWTTGSLPEMLPPLTVETSDTEAMAPGVTMFNATYFGPGPIGGAPAGEAGGQDGGDSAGGQEGGAGEGAGAGEPGDDGPARPGWLVAVDPEGEVVWYYQNPAGLGEVSRTAEGTLLVQVQDTAIREIDLLGNTVREYATDVAVTLGADLAGKPLTTDDSEPIAIDSSHHELHQLDSGNIVTLSTELLALDGADAGALCPGNPEQDIVSDIAVELSPDGQVVQQWSLTDVYDPRRRPGTEMCADQPVIAPPSWFYPGADGTRDWTHANAVVVDEEANLLLVSIRHLDAVVALRYHDDATGPAGDVLWELGPDGGLDLTDGEWAYHQHAPEPQDDGTLLLYDNGNRRPGTASAGQEGAPPYSRAVVYRVDAEAGTVTQVWEHRDEDPEGNPVYAEFLGDADRLDNGDVLITHGGAGDEQGILYARLVEVVPGDEPDGGDDDIVFDMTVGTGDGSWTVYRADRLPSLYGDGVPAG